MIVIYRLYGWESVTERKRGKKFRLMSTENTSQLLRLERFFSVEMGDGGFDNYLAEQPLDFRQWKKEIWNRNLLQSRNPWERKEAMRGYCGDKVTWVGGSKDRVYSWLRAVFRPIRAAKREIFDFINLGQAEGLV